MMCLRNGYAVCMALAALIFTATGCKKDKQDTDTSPVVGTWKCLDQFSYVRYIIFKPGNTLSLLEANTINVRSLTTDVYVADDKTISYSDGSGGADLFYYTISNDTLYTSNVNETHTYVKSTVDESTWVKNVTTLQTQNMGVGGYLGVLEWDGYDFLVLNPFMKRMYRFNGTDFSLYDSISFVPTVTSLSCKGIEPWVNYYNVDDKLHKINGVTGTEITATSDVPAKPISTAATTDGFLVLTTNGRLYSYNLAGDNFTYLTGPIEIFTSPSIPPDMVVKDGYAYVTYYSVIFKLDLTTFQAVETYRFNQTDGVVLGLTWDGTSFWALTAMPTSTLYEAQVYLRKIQL